MATATAIPARVHLIGIGGAHMSAIAQILHAWGHAISGSDQKQSAATDKLAAMGIDIRIGHASEHVREWDPLESTCRHASLSIL